MTGCVGVDVNVNSPPMLDGGGAECGGSKPTPGPTGRQMSEATSVYTRENVNNGWPQSA